MRKIKYEIGYSFIDETRSLTIIDVMYKEVGQKKEQYVYYKCRCNKCGYDGNVKEQRNLEAGIGCSCCAPFKKTLVVGKNDIATLHPDLVDFFIGGAIEAQKYLPHQRVKIFMRCPRCKRTTVKKISIPSVVRRRTIPCICIDGKSKNEKYIYSLLEQLNVDFTTEYNPSWCKYNVNGIIRQGYYDFYFKLGSKKYIIETDGEQHYRNTGFTRTYQEQMVIDNQKDLLAMQRNISVIRIDCNEIATLNDLRKRAEESLSGIFDLTVIDWDKCSKFAISSLIELVCKLKQEDSTLSTTDIGKITKIAKNTVRKYLKIGNELKWCKYDANEEKERTLAKGRIGGNIPLEVFDSNLKSLGVFLSTSDAILKLEKMFSITINRQAFNSAIDQKRRKTYKGLSIKTVTNKHQKPKQLYK